jgi:predicted metalloprotease with PDZ domain
MTKPETYLDWLGLVSHEFFHTWNVRRLRPRALQQYDYQREQYVEELWIAEGITSYFDDLFVLRAGLSTPDEYLGLLNKTINVVEDAPGKRVQSLQESSWDTWIKHYRPDENTPNSRISYYTKGAIVAFLLDAKLRELTNNQISLDNVMQQLWKEYREIGYTLADFETLVGKLVDWTWKDWFDEHIRCAEQLNYHEAFQWLGLERVQGSSTEVEIGCEFANRDGRWVVTKVIRDAPGSVSGLQVEDELIAVEGWRLPKDNWRDRLQQLKGQSISCTVARRGQLKEVAVLPRKRTNNSLRFIEHASYDQHVNRRNWLYSGVAAPVPPSPYFD